MKMEDAIICFLPGSRAANLGRFANTLSRFLILTAAPSGLDRFLILTAAPLGLDRFLILNMHLSGRIALRCNEIANRPLVPLVAASIHASYFLAKA
jgi:hypothetical protein